jgi:hypothetical protein
VTLPDSLPASSRVRGHEKSGRSVYLLLASAGVIGLGAVIPGPLRIISLLVALTAPGWSLIQVLFGRKSLDRIVTGVLSVGVSLVLLIAVTLFLDAAGILLDRRSIDLSIAVLEFALSISLWIVTWSHRRDSAVLDPSVIGGSLGIADRGHRKPAKEHRVRNQIWTWLAVGVAALSIGGGVALVHSLGPTPKYPAFTTMSLSGDLRSAQNIEVLKPGPTVLKVRVGGDLPVTGVLTPYLNGRKSGTAIRIRITTPQTVSVVARIPSLKECQSQLAVTFTPSNGSTVLRVIRYVKGLALGPCTDFGSKN